MKKFFSKFSTLLLAALLIFGVCVPALADDASVTVEAEDEGIVFAPGIAAYPTDLFDNFKGCMPGDTRVQKVILKNVCPTVDWMTFSMKAVPHDENNPPVNGEDYVTMNEFLHKLSMTVKNGDTVIFNAPPDETDGLSDFITLATLAEGETAELTVELTVPADLGSEYMNRIGEVDWVFQAEGDIFPTPPPGPPTGDTHNSALWYALMGLGFAALLLVILVGKKKKKSDEAN